MNHVTKSLITAMLFLTAALGFTGCDGGTSDADSTVSISAISGVTAPVLGGTPVTTITETDEYIGTVAWSPDDDTFAASTVYTATITLTAKTGYTFNGITADFFTVDGAAEVTNEVDSAVVTAVFPNTDAATVTIAAIPGVTAPVAGETPVTTITETDQYTGTVAWSPGDATYGGETIYTATINLTPKTGYTFTGVSADYFTVDGATTTNSADSAVVTAVFPETDAATVTIAAISGVTAPVLCGTPVTEIIETDQYTGTVAWSPDDAIFTAITVYTATITLTAKTGYTFNGITADFFTVDGAAEVTNEADSGFVTAVFPDTDAATVTIAAISGVTAPVAGETPVTTITETEQYTGTVAWSPDDATYGGETIYTATINLTPKTGYTFNGITADFFTVDGAEEVTNEADSAVVTAEFPLTDALPVSIKAIPGVRAPVAGKTPVTIITETDQYTGTVTWSPDDTPFGEEIVYTATIALSPKTGYTFADVSADFFTVDGATTTNSAGSAAVSAVFPATADITPPSQVCITGISTTGSSITITWTDPSDSDLDHILVTVTRGTTTATSSSISTGTGTVSLDGLAASTAYTVTFNSVDTSGNVSDNIANYIKTSASGESLTYIQIYTAADLQAVNDDLTAAYMLMNDIDLTDVTWTPIGDYATDTSYVFSGIINGCGHSISNLELNSTGSYQGLFGYISGGGRVYSLGLTGVNISGASYVGGLTGRNSGTIVGCHVSGEVTDTDLYYVGGLVGWNSGTITDSYAACEVTGNNYVGGLVGYSSYGTITGCHATGEVKGSGNYVGGLMGCLNGTLTNCHASAAVTSNSNIVGGLVGENLTGSRITCCYASTGSVSGLYTVGGLTGRNNGTINNSYASGSVSGNSTVGGLAGENYGTITDCYAAGAVSGRSPVGGLIGENDGGVSASFANGTANGSLSVIGTDYASGSDCIMITGAAMQTESTFTDAGWDFADETTNGTDDYWDMDSTINGGYPYLTQED